MTLKTDLDRFPPFLVYASARKGHGQRFKLSELVNASGLSERTFTRIARMRTWGRVRVDDIVAFCEACNVDPMRPYKTRRYIRRTLRRKYSFRHLLPRQKEKLEQQLASLTDSED